MTTSSRSVTQLGRRAFLRATAAGGAATFLAATLPGTLRAAGRPGAAAGRPAPAQDAPSGSFRMATWIGYIDVSDEMTYPSLDRFRDETGIEVDYQEVVEGNEEFFASDLRGPLEAGLETGWDMCVLTDWMVQRLSVLGWLESIDTSAMTNYPANLEDSYRTRAWDPENTIAAPWQSGMTGLGYDAAVTGELSAVGELFSDRWAGRVTWLSELNESAGMAAIYNGDDPSTLDQAGFDAALATLTAALDAGIPRRIAGNSYIEDMTTGDVVVAMAWSGDVLGLLVPDQRPDQDFRFTLPDEGGMLFTDNMVIPRGALNKAAAERFIDWYYIPANAAQVEAYVNYVCPVKGAGEEIRKIDPALAENVLIFPTEEMRARSYDFVSVEPDVRAAWEAAFAETIGL